MRENATDVIVGAGVLAVAIGFVVYAAQFSSAGSAGRDSYPLTASFRSVEGVTVGTDVRLAGVKVGTVTGLDLNPETFRAETTFAIDGGLVLPDDSAVIVASEGLLGGTFIEVLPGGSPFNLEAGGEIEDTQSSVSLVSLLLQFVSGSGE